MTDSKGNMAKPPPTKPTNKLAAELRRLRLAQHLKIGQAAADLKIHDSSYTNIEHGTYLPGAPLVVKFARFYSVGPETLLVLLRQDAVSRYEVRLERAHEALLKKRRRGKQEEVPAQASINSTQGTLFNE